jgi:hypothetical protein
MTENALLSSTVPRYKTPRPKRKRYTFNLAESTYERLADAAYDSSSSLSAYLERALLEFIRSEEDRLGRPFPKRPDPGE